MKKFYFDLKIFFVGTKEPLTEKDLSIDEVYSKEEVIKELKKMRGLISMGKDIIFNMDNVAYLDISEVKNEDVL